MVNKNRLVFENGQLLRQIQQDNNAFAGVLETMAKFYKYSLTEQLSLHNHAPAGTRAVAAPDVWHKLGTETVHGAKEIPILVAGENEGEYSVLTVYDVKDTAAYQNGDEYFSRIPWQYSSEMTAAINKALAEPEEASLDDTIRKVSQQFTLDSGTEYPNIVAAAVEYMVRARMGLEVKTSILTSINRSTLPMGILLEDINKTAGGILRSIGNTVNNEQKRIWQEEQERENGNQRDRDTLLRDMGRTAERVSANEGAGGVEPAGGDRTDSETSGRVRGRDLAKGSRAGDTAEGASGDDTGTSAEGHNEVHRPGEQRPSTVDGIDASGDNARGLTEFLNEELVRINELEDAMEKRKAYFSLANMIYAQEELSAQLRDELASDIMQRINATLQPVVTEASNDMADLAIQGKDVPEGENEEEPENNISLVGMDSSIRDWYMNAYPDDELGADLKDITFADMLGILTDGKNFYEETNVADSVVRERLFTELSELAELTYAVQYDYQTIYNMWLNSTALSHTIADEQNISEDIAHEEEKATETEADIDMAESAITENMADSAEKVASIADEDAIPLDSLDLQAQMTDTAGKRAVFMRNLAAIQIVHRLESTGAEPTEQELAVLNAYSGFGGISEAFDAHNHAWLEEYKLARKTLTESEYNSARRSTLSAFYTPPEIIESIYKGLEHYGFAGGNILDPSTGTGRFLQAMPENIKDGSRLYGVELDELTAKVAKYLNKDAVIINSGYETSRFKENSFDLAISNVPFGNYSVFEDEKYLNKNYLIHDYFPNKMLDNVRPGGLVVCITSKGTMDKKDSTVRAELARKAELVKALRLPTTTFADAGTSVVTDVLIFKKREKELTKDDELPSWVDSVEHSDISVYNSSGRGKYDYPSYNINQYFIDNPDDILGRMKITTTAFGYDTTVEQRRFDDYTVAEDLADEIEYALTEDDDAPVRGYEPAAEPLSEPEREPLPENRKPFGFYLDENNELYYLSPSGQRDNSVNVPKNQQERIKSLLGIRDHLRKMLDAELAECSDEQLDAYQVKLKHLYDEHVAEYGEFASDSSMQRIFGKDSANPLLTSLELIEDGKVIGLSDVFTKRTIHSYKPPTHADTPQEALMISLHEKGKVDLEYVGSLLDKSREEVIDELEFTSMYEDFQENKYVQAEEYLSGDIRSKMENLADLTAMWRSELKSELEKLLYPVDIPVLHSFPESREQYSEIEKYAKQMPRYYSFKNLDDDVAITLTLPENHDILVTMLAENDYNIWSVLSELRSVKASLPEYAKVFDSPEFFLKLALLDVDVDHRVNMDTLEEFPGLKTVQHIINVMHEGNRDIETGLNHAEKYFLSMIVAEYDDGKNPAVLDKDTLSARYREYIEGYTEPFADYVSRHGTEKMKKTYADIERAQKNYQALEQVKPKDLTADEIEIHLGATWIPTKYIHQFIRDTICDGRYCREGVEYSSLANEWKVNSKEYNPETIANEQRFGIPELPAMEIIEKALNKRNITVYKTAIVNGEEKRVADQKKTLLANQKLENIMSEFDKWLRKHNTIMDNLVSYYNRHFNNIVPRNFDGAGEILKFPDMNPEITLRPHQKDAVAQTLFGGNTLLAHVVGAGKSFEMQASAMEAKRIGLCKKSMMVMPGHLLNSFGAEFMRLYPNAKILVATPEDFKKGKRQEFFAKITGQDWDAVIMSYEQFSTIPLSIKQQRIFLERELNELRSSMAELDSKGGKSWTVKKAEQVREKLIGKLTRLDALAEKHHDVDGFTFEQLGIDRLYVDESHNYKNLDFFTKMQGIQSSGAEKSFDMYSKIKYLNEMTGERGVVFASGTPVSNSMAELYTLQRYLRPSRLKKQGLAAFDAWAANFGQNVSNMEITPEGKGFKMKTRFSKFFNTPELISMFKEFANVKTGDMLKLPVPEAEIVTVVAKPTPTQQDMIEDLADRAELIRNGNPVRLHEGDGKKGLDNMLVITKEGRELALDPRLVNPDAPAPENGKISMCVENAAKIFHDTMEDKSTQVIFSDIGTPKKDGSFNVYDAVRDGLIEKGVPADQIVFIHDYDTPEKKEALFKKIRKGDIRIILGSSEKLGVGTNIQDRLICEHDLDCPWKPSQIEQRKGRIQRRGNKNDKVKIFRYITENTFDSYMWQTCENKQKFISQVMTSRSPSRTAEDVDEVVLDLSTTKALCCGSPLIKEKFELDNELTRLKLEKAQYDDEHIKLNYELQSHLPGELADAKRQLANIEHDIEVFQNNHDGMVLNGKAVPEAQIGITLREIAKKLYNNELSHTPEGKLNGLPFSVVKAPGERPKMVIRGKKTMEMAIVSGEAETNAHRVQNLLSNMQATRTDYELILRKLENRENAIKTELARPFEKEERYQEVIARMRDVDLALADAGEKRSVEREIRKRNEYIDGTKEAPENDKINNLVMSKFLSLAQTAKRLANNQWSEHCDEVVADKMRRLKFPSNVIADALQHLSPSMLSADEASRVAEHKQIAACR